MAQNRTCGDGCSGCSEKCHLCEFVGFISVVDLVKRSWSMRSLFSFLGNLWGSVKAHICVPFVFLHEVVLGQFVGPCVCTLAPSRERFGGCLSVAVS